jgi:hypothetical protein
MVFARRLPRALNPHCKANLNPSPRYVHARQGPVTWARNLKKHAGSRESFARCRGVAATTQNLRRWSAEHTCCRRCSGSRGLLVMIAGWLLAAAALDLMHGYPLCPAPSGEFVQNDQGCRPPGPLDAILPVTTSPSTTPLRMNVGRFAPGADQVDLSRGSGRQTSVSARDRVAAGCR